VNKTSIEMDMFRGTLLINTGLWSRTENAYKLAYLTFDTGATTTVISPKILHKLGYEPLTKAKTAIITASEVTYVSEFILDALKINDIELKDVEVHALELPEESFSVGVIGMNIIRLFDVELLFSKKIIKLKRIDNGL
jgi:predicted aspartyl protease